jgi:hypothetical protein
MKKVELEVNFLFFLEHLRGTLGFRLLYSLMELKKNYSQFPLINQNTHRMFRDPAPAPLPAPLLPTIPYFCDARLAVRTHASTLGWTLIYRSSMLQLFE